MVKRPGSKTRKKIAAKSTAQQSGSSGLPRRRSGRPSRPVAEQLREHILDTASALFLKNGYGLTSIEAVARSARISKRTFYHRFDDKAALFSAVIHRIIDNLHPPAGVPLISDGDLQDSLQHLARLMLQGAVSPQGIALTRLIFAESARFPELAVIANEQGGRQEAISLIAGLLEQHAHKEKINVTDPEFAAQQFLQMVITIPQRRAMGLGTPMSSGEIENWVKKTVDLFLNGCRGYARTAKQR